MNYQRIVITHHGGSEVLQRLHRVAKVKPGDRILIHGARGGDSFTRIGQAGKTSDVRNCLQIETRTGFSLGRSLH